MIDLKDMDPGRDILVFDEKHDRALGGVRFGVGKVTAWGKLIEKLTGFSVEADPEDTDLRRYSGDGLLPGPAHPSYAAQIRSHWLTTLTPEALRDIRERNREYCQTCVERDLSWDKDDILHQSVVQCEAEKQGACPAPQDHHAYLAGGLAPSWDLDSRDRALLLLALDEAMSAAEDC